MRLEHWFYTLPLRLRSLFRPRAVDQELDDEMQYHFEQLVQERTAKGMPVEEARLAALRAMDGLTQNKEKCREARHVSGIIHFGQDLRHGIRGLWKSPAFTAIAVLTLALGIGANSAIFSVVNAILLRPLSFPDPDRLVRLWETRPSEGRQRNVVNPWNFLDWRENTHSFVDLAAVSNWEVNLTGMGEPVAVPGSSVSPGYFSILGIEPVLGRTFQAEDAVPGQDSKIILSYGLWQQQFGGDRQVLGKTLNVNGAPATVIGVMPKDFNVPGSAAEVWSPLPITRSKEWAEGRFLTVIARLKPGVTLEQARQDIEAAAKITARLRPDLNSNWSALCYPMLQDLTHDLRLPLFVLLGAVGFLLLIACANVGNLVLMRSAGREREIALCQALGATRFRIIQRLFAEGLVLAAAAMAAGLAFSWFTLHALLVIVPQSLASPRSEPIHMDYRVMVFTLSISILTAVLFSLAPSVRLSRLRLHESLKQVGHQSTAAGSRKMRHTFVVMELALAILLCMGAGLMLRSFHRLLSVDPGFRTENVVTMRLFTSPAKYHRATQRTKYMADILTEIRNLPGVQAAGTIHFLPLRGMVSGSCFGAASQEEPNPATSPDAQFLIISDGYLEAMQTPLVAGRDFDARDRIGSPTVMLVNQAFVRKFLPNQNPLGRKFSVCWTVPNPAEIVGVTADARQADLNDAPEPTIYLSNSQAAMFMASLAVRAKGDSRQITDSVISAIHRVDPEQAVSGIQTLQSVLTGSVSRPRFQMILLMIFAGLALSLAAIGVYGVISYSVEQRRREIGIRLALGAQGGEMLRLVMKEAIMLASLGLATGIGCVLILARILSSLLFEIRPYDLPTLGSASLILLATAALAAYLPALRAMRVDPMLALRSE